MEMRNQQVRQQVAGEEVEEENVESPSKIS